MEIFTKENLVRAKAIPTFRTCTPLKENQVSFVRTCLSHGPDFESKMGRLGGWGWTRVTRKPELSPRHCRFAGDSEARSSFH